MRRTRPRADLYQIAEPVRELASLSRAPWHDGARRNGHSGTLSPGLVIRSTPESLSFLTMSWATATNSLTHPAARASADRAIAWWLIVCAVMIFLMVLIGGITRLTESGLSITEWQPIEGVLPPWSQAHWQEAFARYQVIPQFHAIHADMTLEQFKGIYFWEYLHRLWGRLIGIVFFLPFIWFLWRGRIGRALWPKLALIFVLGALQGLLGWYMVESGLEHRIEVSQYRLAAHLFAAIVIYGAILWVAFDLLRRPDESRAREQLRADTLPSFARGG